LGSFGFPHTPPCVVVRLGSILAGSGSREKAKSQRVENARLLGFFGFADEQCPSGRRTLPACMRAAEPRTKRPTINTIGRMVLWEMYHRITFLQRRQGGVRDLAKPQPITPNNSIPLQGPEVRRTTRAHPLSKRNIIIKFVLRGCLPWLIMSRKPVARRFNPFPFSGRRKPHFLGEFFCFSKQISYRLSQAPDRL
jgi:hypothetical protein